VKHNGKHQQGRKKKSRNNRVLGEKTGMKACIELFRLALAINGSWWAFLSSAVQDERTEKLRKAYSSRFGLLRLILCVVPEVIS
jgi:hypothetical protein